MKNIVALTALLSFGVTLIVHTPANADAAAIHRNLDGWAFGLFAQFNEARCEDRYGVVLGSELERLRASAQRNAEDKDFQEGFTKAFARIAQGRGDHDYICTNVRMLYGPLFNEQMRVDSNLRRQKDFDDEAAAARAEETRQKEVAATNASTADNEVEKFRLAGVVYSAKSFCDMLEVSETGLAAEKAVSTDGLDTQDKRREAFFSFRTWERQTELMKTIKITKFTKQEAKWVKEAKRADKKYNGSYQFVENNTLRMITELRALDLAKAEICIPLAKQYPKFFAIK